MLETDTTYELGLVIVSDSRQSAEAARRNERGGMDTSQVQVLSSFLFFLITGSNLGDLYIHLSLSQSS